MNSRTRTARRIFLRQLLLAGSSTTLGLGGCGTLLHKERINRPRSRDLDWKIVALNGLGLVLFFVPGVIAFVVDFYTGAIYLPPERTAYKPTTSSSSSDESWQSEEIPVEQLNLERIESVLAEKHGVDVSLEAAGTRVSPLQSLDGYDQQLQRHQQERSFGDSIRRFFHV